MSRARKKKNARLAVSQTLAFTIRRLDKFEDFASAVTPDPLYTPLRQDFVKNMAVTLRS